MQNGFEIIGPVGCRYFSLPQACNENQGHQHNYDHVTFVQVGSVKVFWRKAGETVERESRVFKAGEFFPVMRDTHHRIKAMEPGTRYACVFTHRDADGAVVQEYQGHLEAYEVKPEPDHV